MMNSNEANYSLATDDDEFWLKASELSLNLVWDNSEDDIYQEILTADASIPREP